MVLLSGIAVGFLIALPVGAIGTLCLLRTLQGGFWVGLVSGLGAATADALYGLVVVLGQHTLRDLLLSHQTILKLCAGGVLVLLALQTLRSRPGGAPDLPLQGAYFSTLALTLGNPMTLLSFAALLTSQNLQGVPDQALQFVLGCFVGSGLWWVVLASLGTLLGTRLNAAQLGFTRKLSGGLLLGLGMWTVLAA